MVMAFILWGGSSLLVSQNKSTSYAGEIFGKRVPYKDYNDISKILNLFVDPGSLSKTSPEGQIWFYLVLDHEARKNKISVTDEEVRDQIEKLFSGGQAFNPARYENWVRNVVRENPRNFEELVREFIRIQKLISQTVNQPMDVNDQEITKKYLDGNNTLDIEFAKFASEDEAKKWGAKVTTEKLWEEEKKKDPKLITTSGSLSLPALGKKLEISENDTQSLLNLDKGTISPLTKTGDKGFVIIRILNKKVASEKDINDKIREDYRKKVLEEKNGHRIQDWSAELMSKANAKKY